MNESEYVIQSTEPVVARCPECSDGVDLLIRRGGGGPMFYVCFRDRLVYQVGVGRVNREGGGHERAIG